MNFKDLKKVSLSTLAYGLANALSAGAPLLLLPLYTHELTKEDFGAFSIFSTVALLLSAFVGLGSYAAVQRRFYDLDEADFKSYLSNAVILNLSLAGLTLFLSFIYWQFNDQFFGINSYWLLNATMAACGLALQQILLSLYQVQQKISSYIKYQVLSTVFLLGLPVLLVFIFKWGLQGALLGSSTASILFGFISCWILFQKGYLSFTLKKKYLSQIIHFGYPLFPQLISGWAIAMMDRFFLQKYWGLAAVGAYSLAFQLSQPLSLLSNSMTQALTPVAYESLTKNTLEEKNKILKIGFFSVLVLAVLGLILILSSVFFIKNYLTSYLTSIPYIPWLVFGFLINGVYRLLTIYLMYYEKTKEMAVIVLVTAAIGISLNAFFIPLYGALTAAIISFLSFSLIFVLTFARAYLVYLKSQTTRSA